MVQPLIVGEPTRLMAAEKRVQYWNAAVLDAWAPSHGDPRAALTEWQAADHSLTPAQS